MFALMSLGSITVLAQTESLQDQLNSAYKNKILLIRNFYSGTNLEFEQNGVLLGNARSAPWTLAFMQIASVTASAQGVEVVGNRVGALFQKRTRRTVVIGKLNIHIARPISNTDTEATIRPILSKIFIDPQEDLRPMLPDYWRYYLTGSNSETTLAAWVATLEESVRTGAFPPSKDKAPRVVHAPVPEYTKEARNLHVEGQVLLGVVVDVTGTAVNICILEPLGMGLDEQVVSAVKKWKFRPSKVNGQPVPARTDIEVTLHTSY
jgi:TonB family protein